MEIKLLDDAMREVLRERKAGGKHWILCVDVETLKVIERLQRVIEVEVFRDHKYPFLFGTIEKERVSLLKFHSLLRQTASVNLKQSDLVTMGLIVIALKDLRPYASTYAQSVLGIECDGSAESAPVYIVTDDRMDRQSKEIQ